MILATDQNTAAPSLSALSQQVLAMRDTVFAEWERETRRHIAAASGILRPILLNTLPAFFDNLAEALTPDYPRPLATSNSNIASAHGSERARMTGYGPGQIIHEYQLFREVFASVAEKEQITLTSAEWLVINRSIDTAVRESVTEFTDLHEAFRHRVAASLSHDMRTPLSVIVNGAHLLIHAQDAARTPTIAQKILDNGKRLSEMVGELLDALSFQGGQRLPLVLTQFDILELATAVCEQFNDSTSPSFQHGARCELTGVPVVGYWCRNSLQRALENLINNALKYGDGGSIRIQVAAAHGRMMLTVHNAGNPIPPEQRGRIFEYLRREGGAEQEGWGIGLPFVQSVAESHGGSTAVDSSPDTGTTFLIDIPVDCRPFVEPLA